MKKIVLLLLMLGVCLPLLARDEKRHELEIAYEGSDYGYREPHMEYPIHITAKKKGVNVLYRRNSVLSQDVSDDDPTFASIEYRYMSGKADYDGYLMNGAPFKTYDEKDYYMEAVLKFGRYYQLSSALKLWPYIGVGWRSLRNGEDADIEYEGVIGHMYQRTSTYMYIPLGLSWTMDAGEAVRLTLNGQFDLLVHGNQSSHTDDLVNAHNYSNEQHKGYGVRASAKLETDVGKVGLFVEPFWRYWKIQTSTKEWVYDLDTMTPVGYVVEPFNITREYGIRAGITFF